jgi:hypothetical protein
MSALEAEDQDGGSGRGMVRQGSEMVMVHGEKAGAFMSITFCDSYVL